MAMYQSFWGVAGRPDLTGVDYKLQAAILISVLFSDSEISYRAKKKARNKHTADPGLPKEYSPADLYCALHAYSLFQSSGKTSAWI